MSEQKEIRKRVTLYSGAAMIEFADWHRLEDILDEQEAIVMAVRAYVEVLGNPGDFDGWLDNKEAAWDELKDSLEPPMTNKATRQDARVAELREKLAEQEHDRWSRWMAYLFSKGKMNDDGTWTMPKWAVERWSRQAMLVYGELSEEEKDSDRKEADHTLALLAIKEERDV